MFEDDYDFNGEGEPEMNESQIELASNGGITITIPRLPVSESQIIEGVCRHFKDRLTPIIEERLEEIAQSAFAEAVKRSADEMLRSVLATPQPRTNSWGEPIGDPVPLRDFITERFERYMKERVDSNGRPSTFDGNKARQEWIVNALGEQLIVEAAKKEVEKVRKSAEAQIANAVANFIATKLATPATAPLLPEGLK